MLPPLWIPTLLILSLLLTQTLCAEDYYKLLGLDKDASDREIKKAYRTLSKKFHPDKNPGDESAHDKFVAVAEAYDVLSDAETRRIYDQYGHDGVAQHKQGGPGGGARHHDPFDLFSRFFGGSGHFGQGGERRGPTKQANIALPLRDFYNGAEKDFTIEKQTICSACEGSGSADGTVDTCKICQGSGMRIQKHQLAPGIFQQMQTVCNGCNGKGKTVRHACPVCGGQRVVREQETYKLTVERGMPRNIRLTYDNEADESPDWVAGDLVLELQESAPEIGPDTADDPLLRTDGTFFRRKGSDLFWREVLSLREAWMGGWSRNLTHLDGHVVRLSRKRGEVVQPNSVEIVPKEGMPVWHPDHTDPDEIGALHVEYAVVLPDQLEGGMEKDFWAVWEKWRLKMGVDLLHDSGRPLVKGHDEL